MLINRLNHNIFLCLYVFGHSLCWSEKVFRLEHVGILHRTRIKICIFEPYPAHGKVGVNQKIFSRIWVALKDQNYELLLIMLLLDVSITSIFFRTFKNSFQIISQVLGHLKCCPRFVFFFLGKQRWRSGKNTCLLPMWHGWLTFLLVFSGYSGFPLSVYKNQLLPNTISNWNAQTRAYFNSPESNPLGQITRISFIVNYLESTVLNILFLTM